MVTLLGILHVTQAEKDMSDIEEYQKSYDDGQVVDDDITLAAVVYPGGIKGIYQRVRDSLFGNK